jgi:ankyrin repeat protein
MFENRLPSYQLQTPFGIGTTFHEAVGLDKLDMIDALLARGANPNIIDASGESAIKKAKGNSRIIVAKRLRNQCAVAIEG